MAEYKSSDEFYLSELSPEMADKLRIIGKALDNPKKYSSPSTESSGGPYYYLMKGDHNMDHKISGNSHELRIEDEFRFYQKGRPINVAFGPEYIWMVLNLEIYADTPEQMFRRAKREIPSKKGFLFPLNADRAAYNNEMLMLNSRKWSYNTKMNGTPVTIHYDQMTEDNKYFLQWYDADDGLHIRLVKTVKIGTPEYDKLYQSMYEKELQNIKKQIPKDQTLALQFIDNKVVEPNELFRAIQAGQLDFELSLQFTNFITQVTDLEKSEAPITDDLLRELRRNDETIRWVTINMKK